MSSEENVILLSCPLTSPRPQREPRQNRRGTIIAKNLKRKYEEMSKNKESKLVEHGLSKFPRKKASVNSVMSEMDKLEARSKAVKKKCKNNVEDRKIVNKDTTLGVNKHAISPVKRSSEEVKFSEQKIEKMEVNGHDNQNNEYEKDNTIPVKKKKTCSLNSSKSTSTVKDTILKTHQTDKNVIKNSSIHLDPCAKRKIKLNRSNFSKAATR
ncbi:uncharacterized protein LOC120345585 [Styela clava]